MRPAPAVATALVAAAAGLAIVGLAANGEEEAARAPAAPTAARAEPAGLAVWVEHGCGSCHAFAPARATGTIGPDLELFLDGADAAYIRRSIVDPAADVAAGYSVGAMPEDYGERIPRKDLDALVAFLAEA